MARLFVPLDRVRDNGRDIGLAPKVAREVAEVRRLLDDRAAAVRFAMTF